MNNVTWHFVKDELPDTNRFVLVCNDEGHMGIAQYIGEEPFWQWQIAYCLYDVDIWNEDENGPIVAWTELPKPPEGVKA